MTVHYCVKIILCDQSIDDDIECVLWRYTCAQNNTCTLEITPNLITCQHGETMNNMNIVCATECGVLNGYITKLSCGHAIHINCIKRIYDNIEIDNLCPQCRRQFIEEEIESICYADMAYNEEDDNTVTFTNINHNINRIKSMAVKIYNPVNGEIANDIGDNNMVIFSLGNSVIGLNNYGSIMCHNPLTQVPYNIIELMSLWYRGHIEELKNNIRAQQLTGRVRGCLVNEITHGIYRFGVDIDMNKLIYNTINVIP